jgi:outer membrane protein OmpA-like peptidoglycan-associated protein
LAQPNFHIPIAKSSQILNNKKNHFSLDQLMLMNSKATCLIGLSLAIVATASCVRPPYNNFKRPPQTAQKVAKVGVAGLIVGSIASGGTLAGALTGGAVGGVIGGAMGLSHETKKSIINELQNQQVQYVQYGDTMTLVVPTDIYYMFQSPRLNELAYPGLLNIIKLLKLYPCTPIFVAGFTDNVGSREHKKRMSQAQAETMMTYLWANGIKAARLKPEGYGDKYDISDNKLIHGSAHNRRIEIQWLSGVYPREESLAYLTK